MLDLELINEKYKNGRCDDSFSSIDMANDILKMLSIPNSLPIPDEHMRFIDFMESTSDIFEYIDYEDNSQLVIGDIIVSILSEPDLEMYSFYKTANITVCSYLGEDKIVTIHDNNQLSGVVELEELNSIRPFRFITRSKI